MEDEILRIRNTYPIALTLAFVMALSATPSYAVPASVGDKRQEAQRVKSQVDALDDKVEIAAEQYNEAFEKHAVIVTKIERTQADLDATNDRISTLQTHLSVRAMSMYRSGPVGFVEVLLDAKDFDEFATTWDLLKDMNKREAQDVSDLKEARAKAERYKKDLAAQEAAAAKTVDDMTARKSAIESQLSARKSMLVGLEDEIQAIEAAEQARAAAAAARAATSRKTTTTTSKKFPPPTRAPRTEVVNIARAYLGAPYRWGASGPNAFDCSGFTMFVYRQVGVSLPHSSRAQYGSGEKVSKSDLKPGDLVFFGSPIHHVGIYVGGGMYIHSPRTGDVVKYASLSRGDYVGACRP